jgi:hypothetical protein
MLVPYLEHAVAVAPVSLEYSNVGLFSEPTIFVAQYRNNPGQHDGSGSGSKSNLSGGAVAGIVLGSLAAVGLGVAGFVLLLRRRQRSRQYTTV